MHCSLLIPMLVSVIMTKAVVFARNIGMEGDLYEGDIALRTSLPSNSSSAVKLAAIRDVSKIWPGGKVPFRIDRVSIPNEDHQFMIVRAMETLVREVTCIEFLDNNQAQKFDSVRIAGDGDKYHSSSGCWSYVGMQGGEQTLNLGAGCFSEEVILHELLHLLGIIHETNRPDRDNFVEIIWQNIESGKKSQFEKRNESDINMQETPYDFRSRMHYTADSFSKSDAPTIIARYPGNDNFGPLDKLSPTDIVEISLLYSCDIESITTVKYTHANRYANEVRIEQIWDEIYVLNSTIEDKTCEIDVKLTDINEKLSSRYDNNCKGIELEAKVNETIIKVDSCDAQLQMMKELFTTKSELNDYKTAALQEKIKEIDIKDTEHESKLLQANKLFSAKIDQIERQLKELIDSFNIKDAEIEQHKEKANEIEKIKEDTNLMKIRINQLEKENKEIKGQNNQQKELINELEEEMSKMVDCRWSSWSDYSQCSITDCGSIGTKTRTRTIEQQSRHGGAQCTGESIHTIGCGEGCVLLHTDSKYTYYKVPAIPGSKMTSATVLSTCTNNGMIPQCFSDSYVDGNCTLSPSTYPARKMPEILCNNRDPKKCPATVNIFWYMPKTWSSGSACGATKKSFCDTGNKYTSTSSTTYLVACLKPI